jgi:lipid-binding SYLF domain-containing protein
MVLGLNNPLPSSLASECRKTGKILASFVDPRQAFGPDKVIPPEILAKAKGLAILTVVKVGFLGSVRFGSGLVIARLPDGQWSAPSAIATAGAGFGGQIGAELTDFVFILNDAAAVRTFSQVGSITLGGNVSIAAGPIGRNAEASGAASLRSVAGIFSYSKTKGLFAGVSLEGSVLVERKEANEKLYHPGISAKQLLTGSVAPPPAADALLRVLNSRVFAGVGGPGTQGDDMYNDIPVYDSSHDDVVWEGRRGSGYGEGVRTDRTGASQAQNDFEYSDNPKPKRASTWADDVYDRQPSSNSPVNRSFTGRSNSTSGGGLNGNDDYVYSDRKPTSPKAAPPGRPTSKKPTFGFGEKRAATVGANQAVAKFSFDADQPGDLAFKKGDIITITKRTDNENDWWTGQMGDKTGIFPSNYVEVL